MFLIENGEPAGEYGYEIARLEQLVEDLKSIVQGYAPTEEQLAHAPVLSGYRLATLRRPCLVGRAEGHPVLGSGDVITSELWAIAEECGWARTHSRFYRLAKHRSCWNS